MPQAFMGGHKPLDIAAAVAIDVDRTPRQHNFENS